MNRAEFDCEAHLPAIVLPMLRALLPVLVPSWRFFDRIGASPRIEIALLSAVAAEPEDWLEFRSRPHHLSLIRILRSLWWNPEQNEALYLLSCCEKLIEQQSALAEREIERRIAAALGKIPRNIAGPNVEPEYPFFMFRLIVIERVGTELSRSEVFRSTATRIAAQPSSNAA